MAAINDLVAQIQNAELRNKIEQEVNRMNKQKKFGLVFEEHLPECTPLYVIDILEPHNPDFKDNLGKAKALAKYAEEEPKIGRVQLIRREKDAAGKEKFKRLDMAHGSIRQKV